MPRLAAIRRDPLKVRSAEKREQRTYWRTSGDKTVGKTFSTVGHVWRYDDGYRARVCFAKSLKVGDRKKRCAVSDTYHTPTRAIQIAMKRLSNKIK